MKKIVKGNDFTLKIPVMKMVEGQAQDFPLPACTYVVVQVCNQFRSLHRLCRLVLRRLFPELLRP